MIFELPGSVPPAWLAVMVTVPGPTMVAVVPLMVTTLVSELVKETVSPELAVAERLTEDTDVLQSGIGEKVMVWERLSVMVSAKVALVAAEK